MEYAILEAAEEQEWKESASRAGGRWAGGICHPGTWMAVDWMKEREKRCTENGLTEFWKAIYLGGGG